MTSGRCCSVVELRQYTLRLGQRDVLIAFFDHELVETQEAVGIHVIGQFRDLDAPDRFVWLRGFTDMESRATSLAAFYGGPVWAAHRDAANATMVDSDDVLLLRPAHVDSGLAHPPPARPNDDPSSPALFEVSVYALRTARDKAASFAAFFGARVAPLLRDLGAPPIAWYVTEEAENTFPALPVRVGEHVLVALARFRDEDDYGDHLRRRRAAPTLTDEIDAALARPVHRLRLVPTSRSQLR